jgi:putative sporulation protein YyaC
VQGTLDEPVHAGNLTQVLKGLSGEDALILAVDACLGQVSQVGTIALGLGPVRPGAGVNKVLPEVGQLHITGTVNVGGFMEYLVLQNTRLSLVIKMARVIAEAIRTADQMAAILDETEALRRLSVD